jgi:hypothetical protein
VERKERGPNERIRRERTRALRYFSASPARPSVSIFWPRVTPGLWFRLFKTAVIKNRLSFLVSVEIISWHHKKILSVTINHFSSSGGYLANGYMTLGVKWIEYIWAVACGVHIL